MSISNIAANQASLQSMPAQTSTREELKKTQNASIMEAQLNVSIQAGDESLSLLYKVALDAINAELESSLGANAIQDSYDQGVDVSAEATAERIVQQSTAFFSAFREQHTELSDEEAMNQFMDVIGRGIDKGFEEARGILDSLSVLEGEVATNIDLTYEYVQSGLNHFVEQFTQASKAELSPEAEPVATQQETPE